MKHLRSFFICCSLLLLGAGSLASSVPKSQKNYLSKPGSINCLGIQEELAQYSASLSKPRAVLLSSWGAQWSLPKTTAYVEKIFDWCYEEARASGLMMSSKPDVYVYMPGTSSFCSEHESPDQSCRRCALEHRMLYNMVAYPLLSKNSHLNEKKQQIKKEEQQIKKELGIQDQNCVLISARLISLMCALSEPHLLLPLLAHESIHLSGDFAYSVREEEFRADSGAVKNIMHGGQDELIRALTVRYLADIVYQCVCPDQSVQVVACEKVLKAGPDYLGAMQTYLQELGISSDIISEILYVCGGHMEHPCLEKRFQAIRSTVVA